MLAAAGCGQQCFLSREAFCGAHSNLLPSELEVNAAAVSQPITHQPLAAPPDVNYPDRPPRPMSLEEAIAISLENGTPSTITVQNGGAGGTVNDTLVTFTPGTTTLNTQSDRIRVIALNPALQNAAMEASAARFDAIWNTSMNWTTTDNLQQGLQSFNNGQAASFQSSIVKAFASGGTANVSFLTNYTDLTNPPTGTFKVLNPQYTTQLQLGIEQPLWRYFGTEINQLIPRGAGVLGTAMPNQAAAAFNTQQSIVSGFTTNFAIEGILVARLRFDQNRAEFERNLQILVLNAEIAYWKLYQAYGSLYANEEVMRIAHKAWLINKAKFESGSVGPAQYYPVLAQYEEFRGERLKSLGAVIEQERNVRGILGLPPEDGTRIVPITAPMLQPYQPDWESSLKDALNRRPELVLARENVRYQQYQLAIQKNLLKPDLRFFANYIPTGFGTTLNGTGQFISGTGTPVTSNALQSLASDHFNNWTIGLNMNVPIGFRFEHAAVRNARLALAQSFWLLKDQEDRATRQLVQQYQKISEWYTRISATRAERLAYQDSVKARFAEFAAGKTTIADFLLDQQRRLAAAQLKEYEAIAEFNNSLARLEWTKGNILKFNNVHVAEGALPQCAQVRAVEHERERSKAIVLNNRPDPVLQPGRLAGTMPPEAPPSISGPVAPSQGTVGTVEDPAEGPRPTELPSETKLPSRPTQLPETTGAVLTAPAVSPGVRSEHVIVQDPAPSTPLQPVAAPPPAWSAVPTPGAPEAPIVVPPAPAPMVVQPLRLNSSSSSPRPPVSAQRLSAQPAADQVPALTLPAR
jgi:outer membrane protein TolC